MRSELVFGAVPEVSNRYQLCQLVAKGTRKLHKPNTRLQDTVNEVLTRLSSSKGISSRDNAEATSDSVESQLAA